MLAVFTSLEEVGNSSILSKQILSGSQLLHPPVIPGESRICYVIFLNGHVVDKSGTYRCRHFRAPLTAPLCALFI